MKVANPVCGLAAPGGSSTANGKSCGTTSHSHPSTTLSTGGNGFPHSRSPLPPGRDIPTGASLAAAGPGGLLLGVAQVHHEQPPPEHVGRDAGRDAYPWLAYKRANGSSRDEAGLVADEAGVSELICLLRVLRGISQLIVRERNLQRLLAEACNILVQTGGYALVWIGLTEPDSRRVVPVARAGRGADYLDGVTVTWDESPAGQGPTGNAVRSRRPWVSQDTVADPCFGPGREAALALGLASVAAVPLVQGARTLGVVTVYSERPNSFREVELDLLREVAADLALGLQAAEQEQERLQTIGRLRLVSSALESAANAIAITDREGVISWVNPAFSQLTGYSLAEIQGCKPSRLKSSAQDAAFYRNLWETILAGRVWHSEMVNRRKDGSFYTEDCTITPVRDERGEITHFISVKQDITARKQVEEQLRQSQKLEGIGQLAAGVAHDFNNLLMVIRGNADLLAEESHTLSPLAREFLGQISSAAESAANLTRQLLLFGRKQAMQSRAVGLNDLIANLSKMLRRVVSEDIKLDCAYGNPKPFVQGDPGMIEQVVLNLVVNARDAMPQGGRLQISTQVVRLEVGDIRIRPEARVGDFVCLAVRDTGAGIPPGILPRIFEPFFTTKEAGKGTGLGLPSVYGIAKQHQGWVEVTSLVGTGTTFEVFLPLIPAATSDPASLPGAAGPHGGTETILLVEDQLPVRLMTRRVLESYGYQVHEAASAREAMKIWRQHAGEVALLLTDMVMPGGMTGWELSEQLRAQKQNLKVVFMSGYSADVVGGNAEFMRQCQSFFLQKPCANADLAQTVRNCLDGK
jgi:PAS domain S-box-containing protein